MTKKETLLAKYEEVKDEALSIELEIRMPNGELETIRNPMVKEKIEYINEIYNDDLVHLNCGKVRIESYFFETFSRDTFDFGFALVYLKEGQKVARKGWNGKGMFLYLTNGSEVPAVSMKPETANHLFGNRLLECDTTVKIGSHIDLKSADGSVVIGWTASQTDVLAEDWVLVK